MRQLWARPDRQCQTRRTSSAWTVTPPRFSMCFRGCEPAGWCVMRTVLLRCVSDADAKAAPSVCRFRCPCVVSRPLAPTRLLPRVRFPALCCGVGHVATRRHFRRSPLLRSATGHEAYARIRSAQPLPHLCRIRVTTSASARTPSLSYTTQIPGHIKHKPPLSPSPSRTAFV